jgi:hypothetical protein
MRDVSTREAAWTVVAIVIVLTGVIYLASFFSA